MRAIVRYPIAAAVVILSCSVSPALGQDATSFLDKLDGAIEAEKTYCEGLEAIDDPDFVRTSHRLARTGFTTSAAKDERKAAEEFELARRAHADLRRRTAALLDNDFRQLQAINAKNTTRMYELETSRQVDRAAADHVDAQLISVQVDISVMEAENQRLGGSGWLSTPPQVRANNERIAQLTAELTTLQARKRELEGRLVFTYQAERQYEAERQQKTNEVYAKSRERFQDLTDATSKAMKVLTEKRTAHAAAAEAALREKLTLETMDQCLTRRLAQIEVAKLPEKPTPKGEDLPRTEPPPTTPTRPTETRPPETPRSTASATPGEGFPQVVGKLWPANVRIACRNSNERGPETGILNFRFSLPNKVSFEGSHKTAKKSQLESFVVELDGNGRFSKRHADGFTSEMIEGRIEFLTGADGRMRPVGSGTLGNTMDLSPLAGMIGGAFVPGAGHAVKLTPEEREKMTVRCDGTWQLPAS